jgi:hypothetical protein
MLNSGKKLNILTRVVRKNNSERSKKPQLQVKLSVPYKNSPCTYTGRNKMDLPNKDCNLRKTFFFLNHDSTNNEISKILSIVTSKVNFSESNNTPKNIILVVDSTLFLRLLEATGK